MADREPEITPYIHQIALGTILRPEINQNIDTLRKRNPHWQYHLYNNDDAKEFILSAYGINMLRSWERIDRRYAAARADLLRYLLIYYFGGVYLDLKSSFIGPIDDYINRQEDAFIISQWSNSPGDPFEGYGLKEQLNGYPNGEFQQWHVIARPGHPFLEAVIATVLSSIANYRPWREGTGKMGVMNVTGPIPYTLTLIPILDQHPHRRLRRERDVGLVYSIFRGDEHHALHGRYYDELRHPIVRPAARDRVHIGLYMAARGLRDRFIK